MEFEWTNELSGEQIQSLKQLYFSLPLVHIEQYPQWNRIEKTGIAVRYCLAKKGNELKAYTAVFEYKKVEARIVFGPICHNADDVVEIILEVIRYYKAKNYLNLQVLLGMSVGTESTYVQYSLYKKHRFKTFIDKFNKGTLRLKLSGKSDEELLKGFSENHRRAIKKAIKNNLVCRVLQTPSEISEFAKGYYEMYKKRGLKHSLENCDRSFSSIFNLLQSEGKGFFMGVFEQDKMVGGVLMLFRGEVAEYFRGFSLPDERKLPINHITFYEAMKLVKQKDIPYFDFGGYNMLVDENDQVFHINKFKKGFNGEYFFYPPVMYFDLKPLGTSVIRLLKKARQTITPNK